jgi:hypothetical protein
MVFEFDEGQRQATVLALAKLSLTRPGWLDLLTRIATKLGGDDLFEDFRRQGADEGVPGVCKLCGCTEEDCRRCIQRTGGPCMWVNEERTICSACVGSLLTIGL